MRKKNTSFAILVILSVLVILFCAKETVIGQNKADSRREKQYYAVMEEEYRNNMRQMLADKGYSNSGVNVRWAVDEDGARCYTVIIHHRKIDRLDEKEKEALLKVLMTAEFDDERCSFRYEFLTV